MDPERLRQLEELYHAALERGPEARAALLAQTDPELRRELESLLQQDPETGPLDRPAWEAAAEVLERETLPLGPPAQASYIGQSVGPYRILGKLGEGGMGVVYEAEQSHPRRSVALKMIRGGSLVQEWMVRMFQREADALARLRHPGIADVYESGQTATGQHYFTMELVRGEPLNAYLKRRQTEGTTELKLRLALFDKICAAVSYAHQHGVIHRDLKPSNILVTGETDGEMVPEIKILDFGLARITGEEAGASTLVKGLHGTLAYMSPEQSRGTAGEIDLRTDVYSLGVIFYEMLSGALPYEVAGKDLLEAVQTICQEAPKPFRSVAGGLKLDADLESIVRKALEKEPGRRYQSVAALAEDVQRYEHGQAVLAQPPSTLYQVRKLILRHKLAFAFAATLILVLAAFAVTMTVQARRIAGERNRANQEATSAQQVSDFLVGLFEVSDPSEARGNTLTARELLDKGSEKIDRELKNQPVTQARMQSTIGKVLIELGSYKKATELLEAALGSEEALGKTEPAIVETLDRLATVYQQQGDYERAEPLFRRAVVLAEKIYGPNRKETSAILNDLGGVCALRGNYAEAERLFRRSLAIVEKVSGPEHIDLAEVLNNLGYVANALGQFDQSIDYNMRALHIREKSLAPDHPGLAESLGNVGVALWYVKRYAEAAPLLERSLAINRKTLGPDHAVVGQDMTNLANVYRDSGDLGKAEDLYLSALEIREKALGPQHPDVAHTLNRLAGLRQIQRKYAEAEPLFVRSIAVYDKALGTDSVESATARRNLADMYREQRQFQKAEPLYSRALASLEKTLGGTSPRVGDALDGYARMLKEAGRAAEAAPLEARAKAIREKAQ